MGAPGGHCHEQIFTSPPQSLLLAGQPLQNATQCRVWTTALLYPSSPCGNDHHAPLHRSKCQLAPTTLQFAHTPHLPHLNFPLNTGYHGHRQALNI
jgi:hypothetical protein